MYNLGYIFRYDDNYSNVANFCNQNGFIIVEIGRDENGILYQIQNLPKPTEKELKQNEIENLKQQLASTDYITNKLTEAIAKYIETGDNTKLVELSKKYESQLEERQLWRERIRELEKLLGGD